MILLFLSFVFIRYDESGLNGIHPEVEIKLSIDEVEPPSRENREEKGDMLRLY